MDGWMVPTSWIALRSALGISMIAIYLPTTWVMCLSRRIERQGEAGSRCRDGLDGFLWLCTGMGDARSPVVRPFFERVPTFSDGPALQNSVQAAGRLLVLLVQRCLDPCR